jgi:hypothetical protein
MTDTKPTTLSPLTAFIGYSLIHYRLFENFVRLPPPPVPAGTTDFATSDRVPPNHNHNHNPTRRRSSSPQEILQQSKTDLTA